MIIDIEEQRASHCWVVCMDDFKVNFNSLGEHRHLLACSRPVSWRPMSGQVALAWHMTHHANQAGKRLTPMASAFAPTPWSNDVVQCRAPLSQMTTQ